MSKIHGIVRLQDGFDYSGGTPAIYGPYYGGTLTAGHFTTCNRCNNKTVDVTGECVVCRKIHAIEMGAVIDNENSLDE